MLDTAPTQNDAPTDARGRQRISKLAERYIAGTEIGPSTAAPARDLHAA